MGVRFREPPTGEVRGEEDIPHAVAHVQQSRRARPDVMAGYDSQRNRRRGGPSNMGGQRPDRGAREPVTVAASHRLFQSYPFRGAPASSARHPSGHSRRSTPVLCRADFGEPPKAEVRRIPLPRTRVNRKSAYLEPWQQGRWAKLPIRRLSSRVRSHVRPQIVRDQPARGQKRRAHQPQHDQDQRHRQSQEPLVATAHHTVDATAAFPCPCYKRGKPMLKVR
jgi:hypothetical protein